MLTRRGFSALLGMTAAAPALAQAVPDFEFASIDGGTIRLGDLRGQTVLIVNTASLCGFTYQYEALQALHERLQGRAHVLAVPSDDFGGQELATEAEVKDFCQINYNLTLPMTEITSVRRGNVHPFYAWAADQGVRPRWNFHKILLDGDGRIADHFASFVKPDSPKILQAINAVM